MMNKNYIPFTKEMKNTHTILVPNMLPLHFKLIIEVLKNYGYKAELLTTQGPKITEYGQMFVHNDTCYPAILVIGQFIDAIKSGGYDPHKVALILFQTGGGCRASNYISLLRKALIKAGYGYIPVISLNLKGIEKHPGFSLSPMLLYRMLHCILFGDMIQNLSNQVKPYEKFKGDTDFLTDTLTTKIAQFIHDDKFFFKKTDRVLKYIGEEFSKIQKYKKEKKIKVGVVGEIFVKYSPLGNNNLEKFLLSQGAEVVCPGLMDFVLYSIYTGISDYKLYGLKKSTQFIQKFVYNSLKKLQVKLINAIKESGFDAPTDFEHIKMGAEKYIGIGSQMGEGWLLPAEMIELFHNGVNNIVCTQPFGCLPNHIFGKGMMKPLKESLSGINIVAIDYDPGASRVNQENRIKLMLSNAKLPSLNDNKIIVEKNSANISC